MLRNIPNKYTQNTLLEEIHDAGFVDTYDFFYLPMDVHNRANVGYAFINFLDTKDFEKFTAAFTDYVFLKHPSLKIARVSPAHIQGLIENLRHFSNRAVTWSRNSQYRPIVRYQGVHRDLCELLAELPLSSKEEASSSSDPPESSSASSLNPEAAEFVPSLPAGHSGLTGRTCLSPDAGVFVPQAMMVPEMAETCMPEMAEMGMTVELDEQAMLAMQEMPEICMAIDNDAAMYTDMDAQVAPPPGLEGATLFEGAFFGFVQHLARSEELCEPELVTPPGIDQGEARESFQLDKEGLQNVVSQWLREGRQSPSAGGSSSTRSSSRGTPRSVGTPPNLEKASLEAA